MRPFVFPTAAPNGSGDAAPPHERAWGVAASAPRTQRFELSRPSALPAPALPMAAPLRAVAGTAHSAPCGPGERRGGQPATSAQRPRAQADRGTSGHGQRPDGRTGGPLHKPTGGRGGVGTGQRPEERALARTESRECGRAVARKQPQCGLGSREKRRARTREADAGTPVRPWAPLAAPPRADATTRRLLLVGTLGDVSALKRGRDAKTKQTPCFDAHAPARMPGRVLGDHPRSPACPCDSKGKRTEAPCLSKTCRVWTTRSRNRPCKECPKSAPP